MYKKILAAVNEHLNSEVTAKYAMNIARVSGARLYLCFVAEQEMTASTINRAKEAMKRIFLEAEKIGVEIEAVTETGDPVKKIGELVSGAGIDIVFASTRKEDIERRFFAGTVRRLSLPFSQPLLFSGCCEGSAHRQDTAERNTRPSQGAD